MSLEFNNFDDLDGELKSKVAEWVSEYTQGKMDETPQMLPIAEEDVYKKHLGVAAFIDEEFSGYIAAIDPESHNGNLMSEVGSLCVPKEFRNMGIGGKLIHVITGHLVSAQIHPYAFTNPLSTPLFMVEDYLKAESALIPPSALRACLSCPMKPECDGCCDNILIYGGGHAK
ncbi:MAG TPA: GNAT family N-acetyltransferase [Candidatus Saccharimonadales bacterium]